MVLTDRQAGLLDDVLRARSFGAEWERLRDEILHQGTIYAATYSVLPPVIALAGELDPATLAGPWIDLGLVVAAIDSRVWACTPADLVPACDTAIADALPRARACFEVAALDDVDSSNLALACLALARHPAGGLLWAFPGPARPGREFVHQLFVTALCPACQAELEWMHCGDGILDYTLGKHAPGQPDRQPPAPAVPAALPWSVTRDMPSASAILLVASMIASKGHDDWSRRFARLAGDMRCPECDQTCAFVAALPELSPRR